MKHAIGSILVFLFLSLILNLFHFFQNPWYILLPSQDLTLCLLVLCLLPRFSLFKYVFKIATILAVILLGVSGLYSISYSLYATIGNGLFIPERDIYQIVSLYRFILGLELSMKEIFFLFCILSVILSLAFGVSLLCIKLWAPRSLFTRTRSLVILLALIAPATLPSQQLKDRRLGVFPRKTGIERIEDLIKLTVNLDEHRLLVEKKFFNESNKLKVAQSNWPSDIVLDRFPGNVIFFNIESYGMAMLNNFEDVLRPEFEKISKTVKPMGYDIHSNTSLSPTFGGGSWMADLSLDCGRWIDSHLIFESFFHWPTRCLPNVLADNGYHNVDIRPSSTMDYPEADSVLKYHRHFYFKELNYEGPPFRFSRMPDQFAIARTMQFIDLNQKNYLHFQLSSSHADYMRLPHFLPDMQSSLESNGTNFNHDRTVYVYNLSLKEYARRYTVSISYAFKVIHWYLEKYLKNGDTVIIIGDHQPLSIIAKYSDYTVPIHVISKSKALTTRLEMKKFTPGFQVQPGQSEFRHDHLLKLLVGN